MKKKFRYLFKNMGFLFVGTFSSKLLSFLLIPLYTSVLSTTEYGIYDLLYTTVQLFVPILCLNVIDAVMRFSIDATISEKQYTFTISIKYIAIACLLFSFGIYFVGNFLNILVIKDYYIEILGLFISYIICQFTIQFSRGLDDVKGISISGILGTTAMIGFNILFLLVLKLSLHGYFYANICSFFSQAIFLFFHSRMSKFYIPINKIGKQYEREMILYCGPLMLNTLSWHINNMADRYMVTYFEGVDTNGIYSIAYKIPAILNVVQTIFIQAWQLSAIKEYNSEDKDMFYKKIYQSVQSIMILLCSVLIFGTKILAKILFSSNFYTAWQFVPTLLIYIIFNTLSGTIGGIFSAFKDTKAFFNSALVGASVNIILNIVFIYWWGAEGAAIATVLSSIVIWMMRMKYAKKYVQLNLNNKLYIFEYFILFLQAILMSLIESNIIYVIQMILCSLLSIINIREMKEIIK